MKKLHVNSKSALSDAQIERFRRAKSVEDIIRAADKPSEVVAYMLEGSRFKTAAEANRFLSEIQDKWNTTPRPDLFEHSPKEAGYLIYELPSKIGDAIFDIDLSEYEDAILRSQLFRNWRAMLEYFSTHQAGMTASGNLNRKAIEDLKNILEMSSIIAGHPEWIRNEHDWQELMTLRACAQFAGLLGKRKGKWCATGKCAALLAQKNPSVFYLRLFDAWFNRLDWSALYTRDILEKIHFQDFRYFVLSALERTASEWTSYSDFLGRLFHEYLKLELQKNEAALFARREEDEFAFIFRYPFFDYLERMNVVEMERRKDAGRNVEVVHEIRMTGLGKGLMRAFVKALR